MGEHGGGIHNIAIRSGEQIGGFQEDRRTVFPGHRGPPGLGFDCGLNRLFDFVRPGLVVVAKDKLVVVRRAHFDLLVGADFFAADIERDFDLL